VEVGYQWSFSDAIQNLKRDILNGKFGKPLRMKTICLWPRPFAYFTRNDWAGMVFAKDGSMVLDSVANNACAHFLHNMFFLAGAEMNSSALAESVTGRRFRAYDIENFDTVVCSAITNTGVEVLFYASHVTEKTVEPSFVFEFEHAVIKLVDGTDGIIATMENGEQVIYGHPNADHQFKKLFIAIEKCNNAIIDICPPEAAISQTLFINALHELPNGIENLPYESVVIEKDRRWVRGLGEAIVNAYDDWTDKFSI
jgi:predicted dehydrogenase